MRSSWLVMEGVIAIALLLFVYATPTAAAFGQTGQTADRRSEYYYSVVEKALERTAADYPLYEYKRPPSMSRSRVLEEMERGGSRDWAALPYSSDLSQKLIAVEFPIAKGILGYRVLLIRKSDQEKFRSLRSLEELKALRAGAGQDWSITKTFRAAGFNLVTGASYEGLFEMLVNGRFDYFPRGVNEIVDEYEQRRNSMPELAIDDAALLYTPLPVFIYVAPSKPELARRLSDGLERMRASGEFDAMFMAEHSQLIDALNLKNRKVFYVPNPAMAGMAILDRKDLWFTVE